MSEWISKTEALARITLRTGLQNPSALLEDAIRRGSVAVETPAPEGTPEPRGEMFRDAVNLYAGGMTYVDMESDPAIRGFVQPAISLHGLNDWLSELLGEAPKSTRSKAGRKPEYDWDEYERCFQQKVAELGMPDLQNEKGWRSQADVKRFLQDLAARENLDLSDSLAKTKAKLFMDKADN